MHYEEILTQVIALLQQEHRIAYRSTGLAARMQALATPGSILASGESFRLTEGYFAFRALGTAPVQGVREPVAMYEVLGVGPLRTRLQVAAHRGLVRFVGRQRELEQMQQALAHPFSLGMALVEAALAHQLRREVDATQAQTEVALTVSSEQGFPLWSAFGMALRGWPLAMQGQADEGIAQLRQGLAALRAIGTEFLGPYVLGLLAEAYGLSGQAEAGLAVVAEALAAVETTGERLWEAELHRLRGELLLQQTHSPLPEAETCLRQALDIARRQGAKAYELHAAISLARLWQGRGKRAEARALLAEVYGWFTEGFETVDMREARALLDTIA